MTAPIPLPSEPYDGVWNVVYSTARVFWAPVEPRIQAAAEAQTVPWNRIARSYNQPMRIFIWRGRVSVRQKSDELIAKFSQLRERWEAVILHGT